MNDVSPKVTAGSVAAAASTVLVWVLSQIPFVADAPEPVQVALALLIIAGATFGAGYARRDPRRAE